MMFKKLQAVLMLCLFLAIPCFSQIETRYFANDEELKKCDLIQRFNIMETKEVKVFDVPMVDNKKLMLEGEGNKKQSKPYRFGYNVDVSCTLDNGSWITVEGGRLWTLEINSVDAQSLNLKFDELYLPQGAELYVVNQDKTELFGPVRQDLIPASGSFMTETLDGSSVIVYLFEPDNQYGESKLNIKGVVYGYRSTSNKSGYKQTRAFGDCSIDVACFPEYDKESKGVARMIITNDTASFYGTGALLMATDYQYKPYFLTALHCVDLDGNGIISEDEKAYLSNAAFRFNYMKEECGGNFYKITRTFFGATVKAVIVNKDCVLLEINQDVKAYNNICWLGWDKSNSCPTSGAGLHHPFGEAMEIALEYSSIPIAIDLFIFYYDDGAVWPGSSGSPLLNQNKRVVGQLSYGSSEDFNACSLPFAQYNRFYSSWNGLGTDSTRLSTWLDPLGTGQTTIDSSYPFEGYQIVGNTLMASSNVYYIDNLKSCHTVTWSLSDTYYNQNCLSQNTPSVNQCTVNRDNSHQMVNATLTANIWSGSTLLKTLTKTVSAYPNFYGTYSDGYSTSQINLPYPLYVHPGTTVIINSPYLVGATVSYNGSATPTSWSFNSIQGKLNVGIPTTGGAIIVRVDCENGETYYLPLVSVNSANLFVYKNDRVLNVIIRNECCQEEELSRNSVYSPNLTTIETWTLEVYKATSGERIMTREVIGYYCNINTEGWFPGPYIIKAIKGDKVYNEKIIVK